MAMSKYRHPILRAGGVPVIAVIPLGESGEVTHDTEPQTLEEQIWLKDHKQLQEAYEISLEETEHEG